MVYIRAADPLYLYATVKFTKSVEVPREGMRKGGSRMKTRYNYRLRVISHYMFMFVVYTRPRIRLTVRNSGTVETGCCALQRKITEGGQHTYDYMQVSISCIRRLVRIPVGEMLFPLDATSGRIGLSQVYTYIFIHVYMYTCIHVCIYIFFI